MILYFYITKKLHFCGVFGAFCGTRTHNLLITSQLLCQLSQESKLKWRLRRGSNPRPPAWQAGTLTNWATEPYIWWKQQGSNLWPSACKADALPAELCFQILMVTPRGIEPLLPPWKGGVLTAWPRGHNWSFLWDSNPQPADYKSAALPIEPRKRIYYDLNIKFKLATQKGLEPSTSGVTGRHSNQLSYWAVWWWKQQGSNLWPSACKADALPAELCFRNKWWPLGESNPCYHRERVVSWPLDQGA